MALVFVAARGLDEVFLAVGAEAPDDLVAVTVLGDGDVERVDAGALDVATAPIQMKKARPGVRLTALCRQADVGEIERILLCETTTLGVRRYQVERTILPRQPHGVMTSWGEVRGVLAELPDGSRRFAPEYEICRRLANQHGVPLQRVDQAARQEFARQAATKEENGWTG